MQTQDFIVLSADNQFGIGTSYQGSQFQSVPVYQALLGTVHTKTYQWYIGTYRRDTQKELKNLQKYMEVTVLKYQGVLIGRPW